MKLNKSMIKRVLPVVGDATVINTDVSDHDWVTRSPFISLIDIPDHVKDHVYRNVSSVTFTDTSFGGHLVVNPPYGFTTFADPVTDKSMIGREDDTVEVQPLNIGMGRYYAEAIDDNAHVKTLILRFGHPQFASFLSYYMNAVDYGKIIASRGGSLLWYRAGQTIGGGAATAAGFGYFGRIFMVMSWSILAITAVGLLKQIFLGFNDARYYSLRPAPVDHLMAANNILAVLAAERGFIHPQVQGLVDSLGVKKSTAQQNKYGRPIEFNDEDTKELQKLIPNLFTPGGFISLPSYVARPAIMYLQFREHERALMESRAKQLSKTVAAQGDYYDKDGQLKRLYEDVDNITLTPPPPLDFEKTVQKLQEFEWTKELDAKIKGEVPEASDSNETYGPENKPEIDVVDETTTDGEFDITKNMFLKESGDKYDVKLADNIREKGINGTQVARAVLKDGLAQIALNVDYLGSSTATFSNSFKDVPAKEAINSVTGAVRDIRFNFSDGNLIHSTISDVIGAARDVALGAADTVTAGLSNVLAGTLLGAYFDFPQMWEDSDAQFDKHSFKCVLGGPYGNAVSLLRDIDIPLSLILAGGLPQSAGRSAYTSPMLVAGFCRGSVNIDLGMISDISITTATGGFGHNKYGAPLQVEVTFSIVDLSPMVASPISNGIDGALAMASDEHSSLNRYLGTIAGRSYHNDKFAFRRMLIRSSAALFGASVWASSEGIGALTTDNVFGRMIAGVSKDETVYTLYDD